ncbi:MAG TPA: phosphatidate cytidylyltransferase [Terracidiphilus sp.]|nr:phosphatidate cytidylyltransferase [Terracidiphilus sp.]
MKRVLTAAILIPVVLVLVFLPREWQPLFTAVAALVAALAGWEYMGLARELGAKPPRIAVAVAILALFAGWAEWQDTDKFVPLLGILGLAILIYCTFFSPIVRVIPDVTSSIFCLFYTGFTLIALPALREQANGPSLVLFLLLVVWAGDIAALYIGRAWGRHKLAPSISPNKTWEGTIASLFGSVAIAFGLLELAGFVARSGSVYLSYSEDPWWYWVLLAVILNIAAQVGDLAESAIKRSAGVKDSGSLLPGHGGILDRVDALLLAAPALWYAQLIHHSF